MQGSATFRLFDSICSWIKYFHIFSSYFRYDDDNKMVYNVPSAIIELEGYNWIPSAPNRRCYGCNTIVITDTTWHIHVHTVAVIDSTHSSESEIYEFMICTCASYENSLVVLSQYIYWSINPFLTEIWQYKLFMTIITLKVKFTRPHYRMVPRYTFCATMEILARILDELSCGQDQIARTRSKSISLSPKWPEGQGQSTPFQIEV